MWGDYPRCKTRQKNAPSGVEMAPNLSIWGQKWLLFLPQMGHFGAISTPLVAFFLANFAYWVAPPQLFSCDIAFDPLLPSIWGLLGLLGFLCLMAKKCVFGPKLAIFGSFPYHWVQFSDDFCIYSSSPTCVPLWSTLWSTFTNHLKPLGPRMAKNDVFCHFWAISNSLGAFVWQVLHLQ